MTIFKLKKAHKGPSNRICISVTAAIHFWELSTIFLGLPNLRAFQFNLNSYYIDFWSQKPNISKTWSITNSINFSSINAHVNFQHTENNQQFARVGVLRDIYNTRWSIHLTHPSFLSLSQSELRLTFRQDMAMQDW